MARSAATAVENSFIKGLITEASGLNFPENACTEALNCIFDQKANVTRRLGFDYESGYSLDNIVATDLTGNAIRSFVWQNVAGKGDLTFVVVQVGDTLHFFEVSSTDALSSNKKSFTYDLTETSVAGAPTPEAVECSFSYGNGDLFVFHPYIEPVYIEYDQETDTIQKTEIDIKIRDFEGLDDELELETRPTTLTAAHQYNLYNQGWYGLVNAGDHGDGKPISANINPVTYWDNNRSDFPNNVDIWWLYKNASDNFLVSKVNSFAWGNTPAPKGHYIIDAFYQDRSAISGVNSLPVFTSSYFRPSSGVFAFNRLFMAGVNYEDFASNIYFSKIIESKTQYGECFQSADPTSEHISDLVPSDGGVISIPEMGTVISMIFYSNTILVFASNGIWVISGSEGLAFSASDYVIRKLSTVSSFSEANFVTVRGLPIWWNNDGINALVADENTGNLLVKSLTDSTIKTYIDSIPQGNLKYVRGSFNETSMLVKWVFRLDSTETSADNYRFDRVLVYNLLTNAFYPYSISYSEDAPKICDAIVISGQGASRGTVTVTDNNGATVTDSSAATVTVEGVSTEDLSSAFKYATLALNGSNYVLVFSEELDDDYVDWATENLDIDYDSYFVSGYRVHGEAQRFFQTNYIVVHSNFEVDSSCFIQGQWDFATSGNTSRWTTPQQVYPALLNYGVQRKKLKIRGKGMALQLKFFSETGKPFNLIGWSTFETANQTV